MHMELFTSLSCYTKFPPFPFKNLNSTYKIPQILPSLFLLKIRKWLAEQDHRLTNNFPR